jgi:hypothetical protein
VGRFRKKYYSMDNGVDGQKERSMAATEVAARLLVLRCECWIQAGWLSVLLARALMSGSLPWSRPLLDNPCGAYGIALRRPTPTVPLLVMVFPYA